jgi:hypothetical protein
MVNNPTFTGNEITEAVTLVGICSLLISVVVLPVIVESTSCCFLYYVMDKDFEERGLIAAYRLPTNIGKGIGHLSANVLLKEDTDKV